MITEYVCYKCRCEKCEHEWTTKGHELPVKCPRCKRVTWNEGASMPEVLALDEIEAITPAKLSIDELRNLIAPIETAAPVERDEWQGWTAPQQTYDDQTGEMRTYRKHIKRGTVKWLDAASYQSGV